MAGVEPTGIPDPRTAAGAGQPLDIAVVLAAVRGARVADAAIGRILRGVAPPDELWLAWCELRADAAAQMAFLRRLAKVIARPRCGS